MRLNAVILLLWLLCALAVADPQPCTYLHTEGIHFDDATNTLTCSKDTSFMRIEYNSTEYEFLKCEKYESSHVWKYKNQTIAEASSALNVTCIEYCAIAESQTGVKKRRSKNYHGQQIDVSCSNSSYGLIIGSKGYVSVRCEIDKGWYGRIWNGFGGIFDKSSEKLNMTCMELCATTLTNLNATYESLDNDETKTVRISCPNSGDGLIFNSKHYTSLECSRSSGWTSKHFEYKPKIAESFEKLNVTCKKSPPLCSTDLQSDSLYFNKRDKAWKCSGEAAIEWNSRFYTSIRCGKNSGWIYIFSDYRPGSNFVGKFIVESDAIFNATCAEYCVARGDAQKHSSVTFGYLIECDYGDLFFDGAPVPDGRALCYPGGQWRAGKGRRLRPSVEYLDAALPMQFECRNRKPRRTTVPTTTTAMQSVTGESQAEAQTTGLIVGGSIFGIIIVGIVVAVIIITCAKRRRPAHNVNSDNKQAGQNAKSRDSIESLSKGKGVPSDL